MNDGGEGCGQNGWPGGGGWRAGVRQGRDGGEAGGGQEVDRAGPGRFTWEGEGVAGGGVERRGAGEAGGGCELSRDETGDGGVGVKRKAVGGRGVGAEVSAGPNALSTLPATPHTTQKRAFAFICFCRVRTNVTTKKSTKNFAVRASHEDRRSPHFSGE